MSTIARKNAPIARSTVRTTLGGRRGICWTATGAHAGEATVFRVTSKGGGCGGGNGRAGDGWGGGGWADCGCGRSGCGRDVRLVASSLGCTLRVASVSDGLV